MAKMDYYFDKGKRRILRPLCQKKKILIIMTKLGAQGYVITPEPSSNSVFEDEIHMITLMNYHPGI